MSGSNVSTDPEHLYGYVPTKAVTILFIVLFSGATVLHCLQAIHYNRKWLIATAGLGGLLEIIGWIARAWSSFNIKNGTAYKIQAISLIFGPTPLLGANFMILGEIIGLLGESFSRFPAKRYSVIFLTCVCLAALPFDYITMTTKKQDILCLVIQGAGGGIAASGDSKSQTKLGTDVILVGIIFQLLVIIAFMGCALEYYHRFQNNKPFPRRDVQRVDKDYLNNRVTPGIRWMALGLMLSILFFLIRSIYRIIELAGGWDGTIIHTQIYFNLFDGLMITFTIYAINIFHPGRLLTETGYRKQTIELPIIAP